VMALGRGVKIRFFAWLREEIGAPSISLEGVSSLDDLISQLREMLGEKSEVLFSSDGSLRSHIVLAVNNVVIDIRQKNLRTVLLKEGDIIDIMPLGSGG